MKTWVAILSVVVIVQGVLLARSLKRIERLNEAIFVHSKKETVFIPEMRALKLTVSRVVLETRKGKPVGELSAGGDGKSGPRFALSHSHEETHSSLQGELNTDRAHVMMVQQASGDGTRDGPFSRLTFTMFNNYCFTKLTNFLNQVAVFSITRPFKSIFFNPFFRNFLYLIYC